MLRFAAVTFVLATLVSPALAVDFDSNDRGQIEFVMPSGNIGCVYTPEGGTGTYETVDGKAELSCDRVEPSYVRVILGGSGTAKRYDDVGDASCCGAGNVFDYGEQWSEGPFECTSAAAGLSCRRGGHSFSISRKLIKIH